MKRAESRAISLMKIIRIMALQLFHDRKKTGVTAKVSWNPSQLSTEVRGNDGVRDSATESTMDSSSGAKLLSSSSRFFSLAV